MMIGFERVMALPGIWRCVLDSGIGVGMGEVATEGPFGVVALDRRRAGDDRDAAFTSAFSRSGSCIMVVMSERLEVRLGRESTR